MRSIARKIQCFALQEKYNALQKEAEKVSAKYEQVTAENAEMRKQIVALQIPKRNISR